VWLAGEPFEVEGTSWLDREWTSSLLSEEQLGWDWFQVQLVDGTELMAYRMRTVSGVDDPTSHGSFVDESGAKKPLTRDAYEIEATGTWKSPHTGAVYPSGWRLRVPSLELELTLDPPVADCEIGERNRYWEGPCDVRGTRDGAPVQGTAYAELVGYEANAQPR
jgi:predicted secreted hydrolase